MSGEQTTGTGGGRTFGWPHRLLVLGGAVIVIAVIVVVFLVVKDANGTQTGDEGDRHRVEAVYTDFANAVQSSDIASAGICQGRTEPKDKMAQTAGMLGGIGTAGSTITVHIDSVTVAGDVANVDGSLNTMGTNLPLPAELHRIDDRWCVWS